MRPRVTIRTRRTTYMPRMAFEAYTAGIYAALAAELLQKAQDSTEPEERRSHVRAARMLHRNKLRLLKGMLA